MKVKQFLYFLLVSLFPVFAMAQKSAVRGTVIDDATGEALFGVTVVIKGTTNGSISDFDGKFEIKAEPGVYDLQASFVSYKNFTITGVEINQGEVTVIDQIRLLEDIAELEEVVITAEAIRTTEEALLTVKRKSANVIDGISAANFKKIGDSDAAEAARRVPGVSIEGGKYVYVRGLGDRYTKTTLNNLDIPGLDPDRNSIQIDIFPTNLIDNMIVLKSFTADLPADFTGGIVNIETKDFPDERIIDASVSMTVNPSMHFNNNYIDYSGGKTDGLGFDDGSRALPEQGRLGANEIPSPLNGSNPSEVNSFLREFNPTLGPTAQTSFMDYSLSLTLADQIGLKNSNKLGYIFSASYKNSTRFYDNALFGEYQKTKAEDPDYEMVQATTQEGILAENSVMLGALGGLAYKTELSKYKLNVMHLQNGESRSGQFFIFDNEQATGKSGFTANSSNLEYNQRGLSNVFLSGEHINNDASWAVNWKGAVTRSTLDDPDIRKTAFTDLPGDVGFEPGQGGNPTRLWRELDEINVVGKIEVSKTFSAFGEEAKLKFGANHIYKERDYQILAFSVRFDDELPPQYWNGDPNEVWTSRNLYPFGELFVGSQNPDPNPNQYNSDVNNTGAFVSTELNPFPKLKGIFGLRAENYVQRHTGRDISGENVLEDAKVLDNLHFFPSANLIYAVQDDQNMRGSYSRTIARPSFKELSFAQILDPVSNRIFNGGLFTYGDDWDGNLKETLISNYDLRWEKFLNRGQLISVSAFYKTFENPIELVRIPQAVTTNEFQPRNVGDGTVFGFELEFKKSLDFISDAFSNLSVNGNFTLVESSIEMTDVEFTSRKNFEKDGENITNTRDMAGQAPWIVNAGLSYNNLVDGLDAGFFYNVKGATLTVVGGGLFPDVYSEPFHSLNFNMNKRFGKDQRASLNVSVTNLLNDVREEFYTAFQAQDQIFTSLNPGRSFGMGFSYSF